MPWLHAGHVQRAPRYRRGPSGSYVQGIPVKAIGLAFSVLTALVVVSMVKILGALLVNAVSVARRHGATNRQEFPLACVLCTVVRLAFRDPRHLLFCGIGNGRWRMIALVAALMFAVVASIRMFVNGVLESDENLG